MLFLNFFMIKTIEPFLSPERILAIDRRLEDYGVRRTGKSHNSTDNPRKYAYCTSVLSGLLNDDLKERTIVEVGPGSQGRLMLDFIADEGANAIGIDRLPKELDKDDFDEKITLLTIPMEELGSSMPRESIDLVNIMYLDYFPWGYNWAYKEYFGGFFERREARKQIRNYDSLVADSFKRVLKKGGFVTQWWMPGGSYRLGQKPFVRAGFVHTELDLFLKIPGYFLDIYQKG